MPIRETTKVCGRGRARGGVAHGLDQLGIRELLVEVAQVQLMADRRNHRRTVALGLEFAPVDRAKKGVICSAHDDVSLRVAGLASHQAITRPLICARTLRLVCSKPGVWVLQQEATPVQCNVVQSTILH